MDLSEKRVRLAALIPNTLNALTWMVPSMEAAERNAGKRSFLGKDKGAEAYGKFLGCLHTTVHALHQDRLVTVDSAVAEVHQQLVYALTMFAGAYPQWPDAYRFADNFFSNGINPVAAAVI